MPWLAVPWRAVPWLATLALFAGGCGDAGPAEPARPAATGTADASETTTAHTTDAAPARLPHVLLVSIDTLRADHVGCYGYERDTTPWLDGLAARGVRFAKAYAQTSATLPSHASLFTSLLPPQLSLIRADGANFQQHVTRLRMPDAVTTLAEVLADAGHRTAAFTGGALVHPRYGFGQGFQHFAFANAYAESGLATSVPWLETWLDDTLAATPDARLFLFLHTFDVHDPYRAPAPFERAFSSRSAAEYQDQTGIPPNVPDLRRLLPSPSETQLAEVVALYDNGVRYVDDRLAALEHALAERGLWDEMLVVVLSDHGEEFHDHGDWGHEPRVFDELLRVPLIVRFPGDAHAGRVIETPVPLLDVAPTLVDALGLTVPDAWRGRSQLAAIAGEVDDVDARERVIYGDVADARVGLRSMRRGGWKLVFDPRRGTPALYDLANDPGERRDLAALEPSRAASMLRAFEAWFVEAMTGAEPWAAVPMAEDEQTHEDRQYEMLRELGYVR